MDIKTKIKKVLNYLNKTYTGSGNYESFNEDTASLDDAFTALREAISYENKLNISVADCSSRLWRDKRNINNRIKMAKKLMNDMDLGSADQNTKLMNCALELNGYDTTFTDVYGEGITDAMDQFGQNLCTGTGYWEGLGLIQTVALISNVPTYLADDGKQNIRDAQIFINSCTSAYPVGVRDNDSVNYILGRTDGIIDQWSLKGAFLAFQSIIDAPFSDKINQTTKDKAGNYFKDYNDRAKPLIKAMLILRGFLNTSFDKATTDEVSNAKARFAQTSHTKVDSADFFIALFAFGRGNVKYIGLPKYILDSSDHNLILGYTSGTGFQAINCHGNKLSAISLSKKPNSDKTQFDKLYIFNLPESSDKVPITLNFDPNHPVFSDSLGHTQSLIVDNEYYYTGSKPLPIHSDKSIAWSQNIAQYRLTNDQLIEPKQITYVNEAIASLYKDVNPKSIHRIDFALSPNKKDFIIGASSIEGTQYFLLYDFQKVVNAFSKIDIEGTVSMLKTGLTPTKFFRILKFVDHETKYPYQNKSDAFLPSIQGYAIDDNDSIYISSGLAPKKLVDTTVNPIIHFAIMPFKEISHDDFFNKKCITKVILEYPWSYDYPKNAISDEMKKHFYFFAEPEAIQYCPEHNSVLLSVTWHLDVDDAVSLDILNYFISVFKRDKTFIYEIPICG